MYRSPRETLLREIRQKNQKMSIWLCQKILIKIWSKRGGPDPAPAPQPKKNQIWILCQNSLTRELKIRVVGLMLKKLLTYFEMLIVPHALHCVDSCIFVFTSFDTVWHTVLVSVPAPPLPHPTPLSPKFFLSDLASLSKFTYWRAHS